jgi:hypothetical protein
MKMHKGTIRPGTVLKVLENGIIKASAPGLFSFDDDPENLPPIMPWFIGHNSNAFSQPKQYDEVWIMNFSDNPMQLYWFRKDRIENNKNISIQEENVEILCNREVGGEWCTIYFSDGSGWIISKGDSIIQIDKTGDILLTNGLPYRNINITPDGISLGSKNKSAHPAAFGDECENALYALCALLSQVATAALPNPYTTAIGTTIISGLGNVTNKITNISSSNVTLD